MNTVPSWMLDRLAEPLKAAAAAMSTWLPSDDPAGLTAGDPVDGMTTPAGLVAEGGGVAIVAPFGGRMNGRLLIGLGAELAARVSGNTETPLDPAQVLEPVVNEAAIGLEALVGGPLRVSEITASQPSAAFSWSGAGILVGVPVFDGLRHVATLAIEFNASQVLGDEPEDDGEEWDGVETDPVASVSTLEYAALGGATEAGGQRTTRPLDLLADVEMGVTAELGRTRMTVRDLLSLSPGSVVELDRAAGSPIDLLVNGTLIARGEVVVIDEEFGVRIMEIVSSDTHTAKRAGR